jgi:hypothetical protein
MFELGDPHLTLRIIEIFLNLFLADEEYFAGVFHECDLISSLESLAESENEIIAQNARVLLDTIQPEYEKLSKDHSAI